jgi:hypothetical protein
MGLRRRLIADRFLEPDAALILELTQAVRALRTYVIHRVLQPQVLTMQDHITEGDGCFKRRAP